MQRDLITILTYKDAFAAMVAAQKAFDEPPASIRRRFFTPC